MCDTFVALLPKTKDASIIIGKNSDREPNEMQILEYHPRKQYAVGEQLKCTYISIPQQPETYAVYLGRPYWMWGAEFGVNEHGLAIGNEAVWTKMPIRKKGGLTGMDLLRLALERAKTAQQGIEVITGLLTNHGQGGICGLYDQSMAYHNSFLLADPKEAWVLETADHLWVAKKVNGFYAISNGLTIGEEYDLIHEDVIPHARKKGWLKKGKNFSFAVCYSDWLYTTFSAQKKRRHQASCFLRDQPEMDIPLAIKLLQSHSGEDFHPDIALLSNSVCAHAANPLTRNASQTTGSMICRLKPEGDSQYWFTATAAPCISIFKPVIFSDSACLNLGPISPEFHQKSFWWVHEILHREILKDYAYRKSLIEEERIGFQKMLIDKCNKLTANQLQSLSKSSFEGHHHIILEWMNAVCAEPVKRKPSFLYRKYWRGMNKRVGF